MDLNVDLSLVDLDDKSSVWLNDSGRSRGYFCQSKPVRVDNALLTKLKTVSENLSGKNVRLCLHESPESAFHDMIILERRVNYYRPHKHLYKGESYHIMEGEQAVVIFDDQGDVIDTCVLQPETTPIYRVGADMYHMVMPLSELIIYHESKPGPFLPETDSVFPDWAPDGNNSGEVDQFVRNIMRNFDTYS